MGVRSSLGIYGINPFVRYNLCTKNEYKAYLPLLQACAYEQSGKAPSESQEPPTLSRMFSAPGSSMPSESTRMGTRAWLRSWFRTESLPTGTPGAEEGANDEDFEGEGSGSECESDRLLNEKE